MKKVASVPNFLRDWLLDDEVSCITKLNGFWGRETADRQIKQEHGTLDTTQKEKFQQQHTDSLCDGAVVFLARASEFHYLHVL